MFQNSQNTRIKLVFALVVLVFLIVIIRVFYIQVIDYKKLNKLASDLWSRNLPVQANRGKILDRNGEVIAGNLTTGSLILVPAQIIDKESVARDLSKILGVTYDEMYKHVSKKTSIEKVHPEGRNLDYITSDKINNLGYDGVYIVKETKRDYIYDDTLSHVLGYVGIDNQGLSGLELMYDKYLTGENGSIKYYSDGKGKKLAISEIYDSPVDGNDIYLTIDLRLQLILENELNNAQKKYNTEGAIGIVMNPKTGEILAMSARPSFDPSNYQAYTIETINRNLPIWSSFEPGSTFKILTLAATVNEGKVNLFEEHYYDTGKIHVASSTLHCWKHGGHGDETFLEVVENSCNPGFVVMGQRLGKEVLFDYINRFGFGKKTGIDLNGESKGILFNLDNVGPVELATTSFGQGVSVTAIQQVTAVSAIVNNGNMYTPYVVKKIVDASGNIINEKTPTLKSENLITEETSSLVRYALESVVAKGSGHNAYVEGYRIGGKTGTAQKVGDDGRYMVGNYVLSFIGFMPADDPEYVVYIALDGAKGVTQYGGTASAPIAKSIFESIISLYELKPDLNGIPKEYTWLDQKYLTMPDVIGMDKKEARSLLNGLNVEYSGNGETIIETNPSVGSRIKEGTTVKLLLN